MTITLILEKAEKRRTNKNATFSYFKRRGEIKLVLNGIVCFCKSIRKTRRKGIRKKDPY